MLKNNRGFTLPEVLTALVLTGILAGAIYSVDISQDKTYSAQEQVVEMQQNLRAVLSMMARDIRMVGYDPLREADARLETAEAGEIRITMDITGGNLTNGVDDDLDGAIDESTGESDGEADDPNEDVTYLLAVDGEHGDGRYYLRRNGQILAENIDALDFVYLDVSGAAMGFPISSPSDIRGVQITLVVRAGKKDPSYRNNHTYKNQQGDTIFTASGDNFRRKLLSAEVRCRNLWSS